MDAVISDIHGNLEALEAVLDEIRQLRASRIVCLGDLVCYGPDTLECVRKSASWDVVIAGDWDLAMIQHDPTRWHPAINNHIEFVRRQIRSAPDSALLLDILGSFQGAYIEKRRTFTHGTPNGIREWVFPEDVYNSEKLNRIAGQFDTALICGHSHIQGIFKRNVKSEWEFVEPVAGDLYPLEPDQKNCDCRFGGTTARR